MTHSTPEAEDAFGSTQPTLPADLAPTGPARTAVPQKPTQIGRYRVDRELGRGGMGCVYRAWDLTLERAVALKLLLTEHADHSDHLRFLREARAMAALKHPNIVAVYEVGEHAGAPYVVMELLEGHTLDAWCVPGRLPAPDVWREIALQLTAGLAAAHERDLIHRDLKPANIWLEAPEAGAAGLRVRILDFGLAVPPAAAGQLTGKNHVVGTPNYMSPEQARGGPIDGRSDLFSLGVVLYQMTTGELPFRGDSLMSLLTALAVDEAPDTRLRNPTLPAAWHRLIRDLLAKDPAQRPASAAVVHQRLRRSHTPRPQRLGLWLSVGALALAWLGWSWWRPAPAPVAEPTSPPLPTTSAPAPSGWKRLWSQDFEEVPVGQLPSGWECFHHAQNPTTQVIAQNVASGRHCVQVTGSVQSMFSGTLQAPFRAPLPLTLRYRMSRGNEPIRWPTTHAWRGELLLKLGRPERHTYVLGHVSNDTCGLGGMLGLEPLPPKHWVEWVSRVEQVGSDWVFTHWLDGRFFAQARRHFAGPLDEHFSLAFQATCGTMWFDEIEILGDQEPPGTHEGLVEWQALLADPPNAAERWPQLAARLRTSPIERDRLLALAAQGCADTARVPRLPEPLCLPAATQVSWAPDGTRWAQVGPHTQVVVYERTGKRLEHSQTKNVARAVAWSPDGRQLAIGCEDGSCEVRHWPTLTPLNNLVGHRGPVTAVAYAPDSSLLTAGTDGKVLRRAAATGQAVGGSEQFAPGGIRLLGTSPSGERIAHTVAGVMVKKQLLTRHDPATAAHHRSAITADGTLMATWSCSTRINWFDLATKQITDGPSLAPWLIAELAISSDKRYFAVNQLNGQVLLFGRHTRQPIARSEWLGLPSSGLTFAPDGRQLLLTAPDPVGTRLWDLTNVGRAPE